MFLLIEAFTTIILGLSRNFGGNTALQVRIQHGGYWKSELLLDLLSDSIDLSLPNIVEQFTCKPSWKPFATQ